MRNITVSILFAFVVQASAKDDELVSKMTDRAFNASSLSKLDLDDATLGKPTGQLATKASPLATSHLAAPLLAKPRIQTSAVQAGQEANIEQIKQQMKLDVKKIMAMAGGLAPLAAHADVTPSLQNLINSLIAGGVVAGAIIAAVSFVATFDPVD